MKKKQYLEIEGVVFKEEGFTEEESDLFIDEFIKLVEKHKGQAGVGFQLRTEEELEEHNDNT